MMNFDHSSFENLRGKISLRKNEGEEAKKDEKKMRLTDYNS